MSALTLAVLLCIASAAGYAAAAAGYATGAAGYATAAAGYAASAVLQERLAQQSLGALHRMPLWWRPSR